MCAVLLPPGVNSVAVKYILYQCEPILNVLCKSDLDWPGDGSLIRETCRLCCNNNNNNNNNKGIVYCVMVVTK
jgi:hypothetical protein